MWSKLSFIHSSTYFSQRGSKVPPIWFPFQFFFIRIQRDKKPHLPLHRTFIWRISWHFRIKKVCTHEFTQEAAHLITANIIANKFIEPPAGTSTAGFWYFDDSNLQRLAVEAVTKYSRRELDWSKRWRLHRNHIPPMTDHTRVTIGHT